MASVKSVTSLKSTLAHDSNQEGNFNGITHVNSVDSSNFDVDLNAVGDINGQDQYSAQDENALATEPGQKDDTEIVENSKENGSTSDDHIEIEQMFENNEEGISNHTDHGRTGHSMKSNHAKIGKTKQKPNTKR